MHEHHIIVPRTARYHTLGEAATASAIWIVLHGYGQLARYFLRKFEGLEDGLLIAAPEGLSRFYTDAGHARVGATWMTREDRLAEIADQATYLDALAAGLKSKCPPDIPLCLLGFSQGVATACRWALATGNSITSTVLWAGAMPPGLPEEQMRTAWEYQQLILVHGKEDHLVPAEVLRSNEAQLHAANVPFRTVNFNGGHALHQPTLAHVLYGH